MVHESPGDRAGHQGQATALGAPLRNVRGTTERDSPQAFALRVAAARSVQCSGTTDTRAKSFVDLAPPEWTADLEYVWRSRVAAPMDALTARAKRCRAQVREVERMEIEYARSDVALPAMRVRTLRSAKWADNRARALAMSRADVVASCNQRWRSVACGCGTIEMKVGCDQPQLCGACRRKHSRKWKDRIVAGMDDALRIERAAWHATPSYRRRGMKPGIYLITLTAPHTGDLVTDRDKMGEAVRKLLKHATKYEWWTTYALTWEATAGTTGDGHMHVHLAVISSWVPYTSREVLDSPYTPMAVIGGRLAGDATRRRRRMVRGLHDVWRDAMPGALVVDVQPPGNSSDGARSAGEYLAKYVTKGVDPLEFTGRKAGELLVALRCRRKVSTSARFWTARDTSCECCGEEWRSKLSPCSLQELMPGAVLRSQAERAGWFIPRGDVQVSLRYP